MFLPEVSRLKPYHDISRTDLLRSYLGLPDSLDDQDAIFFRIYQQSHRFHSMLLGLIIFYECVMLVLMASRPGGPFLHLRRLTYILLYLSLLAATIFVLLYTRQLGRQMPQMIRRYFGVYHLYVVFLNLWSVGITLNDQLGGNSLIVYTCIVLSTAFFSMMSPWKSALLYLSDFILLNLMLPFFPCPNGLDQRFSNGINSLFLSLLALALSIYTYRSQIRLKADELLIERQYEEIQRSHQILRQEVMSDTLTGLHNRRYLHRTVAERFRRCREDGESAACIMLDIDHFKRYNDRYGHPQGDRLLQQMAQFLLHHDALKEADIIRYGGEEFALFLYGPVCAQALEIARRVVDSLARKQLPHWDNEGRRVTLSAGVCAEIPIPSDGTLEELIARADTALYEAKRTGRNRAVACPFRSSGSQKSASECGIPI